MNPESIDEKLADFNEKLKEWASKINANAAIFIIALNGFLIALATTGYLGADSVAIESLAGGLYIWQFAMMVLILTALVRPNTELLIKFTVAGIIGFSVQWQIFAMNWPADGFQPIVENSFAIFLFFVGCAGGAKYCLTGNRNQDKDDNVRLMKAG
ncbi:MAG: hypothetical protein HOD85_33480 [Deltaproteobacteria bacterium]|jgi:hypothetical protein|nr:hypothetical protein [Deltaproteobacteria bacterium]MBT4639440.1 hypothetical protein [Deltaproteobacteria bacterium]